MGFIFTDRHVSLLFLLQLVSLLRAGSRAGPCETVFKGFSDCLLGFGENIMSHPQDLDDLENLHAVCSYWNDFLSCTSDAVADCQDEAVELWEKLKAQSKSLDYKGSLFELCSKDNGATGLGLSLARMVWAVTVSRLVMWVVCE